MARSGATVKNQADGSGVGDVRYSMLTEAEFQAQNGTNWVLMDGRNVAGSRYAAIKSVSTIPDHRGIAPRMKNNGRSDGSQNPDGDLALGTMQNDALQGHFHSVSNADKVSTSGGPWAPSGGGGALNSVSVNGPSNDGGSGSPRTANETRSRNLTMNAFIKIN